MMPVTCSKCLKFSFNNNPNNNNNSDESSQLCLVHNNNSSALIAEHLLFGTHNINDKNMRLS